MLSRFERGDKLNVHASESMLGIMGTCEAIYRTCISNRSTLHRYGTSKESQTRRYEITHKTLDTVHHRIHQYHPRITDHTLYLRYIRNVRPLQVFIYVVCVSGENAFVRWSAFSVEMPPLSVRAFNDERRGYNGVDLI